MLGSHWVEDFKGHEGGTSIVHSNKLTPLPGAGRQHLEVNGQGSSTSVKPSACNGPTARPCRVSDRPGMGFVPKMRQECAMGVVLLDNNAQGMEKGSLDTRISTL